MNVMPDQTRPTTIPARTIGELMKRIPWKWALGLLFSGVAAIASFSFSLGIASDEIREVPDRLTAVEGVVTELRESNDTLMGIVVSNSRTLEFVSCVVDAMWKGVELGPFDCPPKKEGEANE